MALTDIVIRNAKPRERPYKLGDSGGLFLLVTPKGGRWWRCKLHFGRREKLLNFGTYPDVPLKLARERRDVARRQVAAGIDPAAVRRAEKAAQANTFEAVAGEWLGKHAPRWNPAHASEIRRHLVKDVFPWLGTRPVGKVTAPELLACIRRIEARGLIETAHRALRDCGRVFAYAVSTGRAERNPAADLRGALTPAVKVQHHAAITDPRAIGGLLRAIDGYRGTPEVQCALRLAPLTFVRPGELRAAEWSEISLEAGEWSIPAERMKMGEPHIVPLSHQAVECLRELHRLTGTRRYVFGVARPMSENTINCALRRLRYAKTEMTGHGFRAMARTILDEVLGERPDLIEHQLAHAVRDPLGRAYNRTTHLPARRDMMQRWADYLDRLKNGAEVVPLRVARAG
jgi:integrase